MALALARTIQHRPRVGCARLATAVEAILRTQPFPALPLAIDPGGLPLGATAEVVDAQLLAGVNRAVRDELRRIAFRPQHEAVGAA